MATTHRTEDIREQAGGAASAELSGTPSLRLQILFGAVWGALALPALSIADAPVHGSPPQVAASSAIAIAFVLMASLPRQSWSLALVGSAIVCLACWLLTQASYPVVAWTVAPMLGAGLAFTVPVRRMASWTALSATIACVVALAILRFAAGRDQAMAGAALLAICAAGVRMATLRGPIRLDTAATATAALLLALGTTAYVGATAPSATWFGSLTSHGPRSGSEVAITFDDGPDPPFTLQIRDVLDARGVKGTFFTVGKALDARPDISRALLEDGHLLGNHSYRHDAVRWLDPSYPELQETQDAFKRNLGVCPALYRPPHGSHTPFMAQVVEDHEMHIVTWDVSAGDWATSDSDLVAKRVLEKVKPGSIILLHDGIDGNIGADRSVVLRALPIILDGLAQRGLKPVTLDKLLNVPGYLATC